jgi:hypothetical protein
MNPSTTQANIQPMHTFTTLTNLCQLLVSSIPSTTNIIVLIKPPEFLKNSQEKYMPFQHFGVFVECHVVSCISLKQGETVPHLSEAHGGGLCTM